MSLREAVGHEMEHCGDHRYRHPLGIFVALAILVAAPGISGPQRSPELPGHESKGQVLLPNGWRIAPVGRHITVDDFPMEMAESVDGKWLFITNDGFSKPILSVVDLVHGRVQDRVHVDDAWLGLALSGDGRRLYSSGGGTATVREFRVEKETLIPGATIALPKPVKEGFSGGLSLSHTGDRLYVVQVLGNLLSEVDPSTASVLRTVSLPAEPYTTLLSEDGGTLYLSLWGGKRVLMLNPRTLETVGSVEVGEHPSALALSKDGRLFVACANTNAVYVIDLKAKRVEETITSALYPQAPPGSTPGGIGLSPDGTRLLVANADNNMVAFADVSKPGASRVLGFIPTGWYPTAARFSRDGKRIYILSGKGLTSAANPRGPQQPDYIAQLFRGALSVLDVPDAETLASYTRTVRSLTPYSDATRLAPAQAPSGSSIPAKVGAPSPIRHVFYVIRENRTYDQILGDLGKGNGDPNICLFGEDVTPNAHALAREFVLLDNFYVDAEVSADGHAFSMGAYATDFVEKTWPMNYARRGGAYLSEGTGAQRNPYGNVTAPLGGYIWDAARRANVSLRSYGEFAHRGSDAEKDSKEGPVEASVPGLKGLVHPSYPPWDLTIPDGRRVDVWLEEFRKFESEGELPALSIIRLPNDHTAGTRRGQLTPTAMVAENDLALGRLVEAISKSRFWGESAIFVLEDDAQDGPDHVDAHRSVALVASPFVRRGAIDSTLYTTSGVLRTMELILGIEPLSQYDAAATPLYNAFKPEADPSPFAHRASRVPLDEKNPTGAYGAALSDAFDLSEADRVPPQLMNRVLWGAVRGASPMPPLVRSAFLPFPSEDTSEDTSEGGL